VAEKGGVGFKGGAEEIKDTLKKRTKKRRPLTTQKQRIASPGGETK